MDERLAAKQGEAKRHETLLAEIDGKLREHEAEVAEAAGLAQVPVLLV
jgi:hypothetical protein